MVSHGMVHMLLVKGPAEHFGSLVRGVDDPWDVAHNDDLVVMPFLNGKVLDINVAGMRHWLLLVNHCNCSLIVHVEWSQQRLSESEFDKDRAKILGNLGSTDATNELSFSRRSGDRSLQLGLECNGATSKTKTIASH